MQIVLWDPYGVCVYIYLILKKEMWAFLISDNFSFL